MINLIVCGRKILHWKKKLGIYIKDVIEKQSCPTWWAISLWPLGYRRIALTNCSMLFLLSGSMNIIWEIKHVLLAFIASWNPRRTFNRIREQIRENLICSRGFSPVRGFSHAREFSQTLPLFSAPGYEGTENMFYFFYKMIFLHSEEKDDIRLNKKAEFKTGALYDLKVLKITRI